MRVETIAVIGSGLMGRGIAHAAAAGGYRTILYDVSAEALDRARRQIRADLDEGVRRGKLADAEAEAAFERLRVEEDLGRAVAEAAFVIEAVPEQIELKLQVFARLDERCPAGAVLASNTSSLSVTEIAAATRRPQQVVGMHFFNPVPKMKLVEIVRGLETGEETLRLTEEVAWRMGKETVLVRESPGFITSRINAIWARSSSRTSSGSTPASPCWSSFTAPWARNTGRRRCSSSTSRRAGSGRRPGAASTTTPARNSGLPKHRA